MLLDPNVGKLWFRNAHSLRSRSTVALVSIVQLPFWIAYSSHFPRDPLANVCRAILEMDAVRFAAPKETDNVLIHQR